MTATLRRPEYMTVEGNVPQWERVARLAQCERCGVMRTVKSSTTHSPLCQDCRDVLQDPNCCKNGHRFTPENTITQRDNRSGKPRRKCRQCHRERDRLRKMAKREESRNITEP